jgi:hypothetical protein
MTRQIASYGVVFGMVALVACGGDPQAPTPLGPPPATPSTTQATPPQPTPPPTSPSSSSLAGLYTLTLNIGSGCDVVPEADRTRRYTASIEYTAEGRYVVTLSDATFLTGSICTAGSGHLSGIGCQQFFAAADNDTVQLFLENNNDDAHGGHIVEQSPSGAWLEIIGQFGGRLDRSSIEASGTGSVWYCRTSSSYPFPCSSFVGCRPTDMRLTLTRKPGP